MGSDGVGVLTNLTEFAAQGFQLGLGAGDEVLVLGHDVSPLGPC